VQISDPWLAAAVLELGTSRPDLVDKPRGWPLPIYDCFDRVRLIRLHPARACRLVLGLQYLCTPHGHALWPG
jgi:hypothetical protein